jgi:hypothetical protein
VVGRRIFFDSRITAAFIIVVLGVSGFVGAMIGLSLLGTEPIGSTDIVPPPSNVSTSSIFPRGFAEYFDYENNITYDAPQYNLESNLSNVMNLEQYLDDSYWSDEVQEQIQNQYFVAIPNTINQFADLYVSNYNSLYPSFITADSLLHAYHVIFDTVLQRCEENNFTSDIFKLARHMVKVSEAQYQELTTSRWKQAALKNLAFFSVAMKILSENWSPPDEVEEWVSQVLSLIELSEGFDTRWFMGQKEDFSQYVPRGHYTRSEELQKYFKVMMWFGRIGFRLYPHDPGLYPEENEERGMNETAQAILVTNALMDTSVVFTQNGTANQTWASIYDTTTFFVGASDDLTPFEYHKIFETVYGRDPSLAVLQDEDYLRVFRNETSKCRSPTILSGYLMDSGNVSINTMGLRFMGQRYVPDSYILGQLVYSNVGMPRTMPKGLDVMAAFGSDRAWELLDDQKNISNYVKQMEMLQSNFGNLTQDTWTQNLYWLWLYSFLPMLEGVQEGQPSFMLESAWTDKQLVSSLGTWTELRHDTVLYVKQSYTSDYSSVPPTPPPGYVEPVPDLYARLSSLCKMMIDGLGSRLVLDTEAREKLESLHRTLRFMQTISEKELQGIALNDTEYVVMEYIGRTLSSLEGFGTAGGRAELVVDVHTDTPNSEVLQEATGKPILIIVAVPDVNGIPFLARGAMYSYYEFVQPMNDRLTDEQWWDMIDENDLPPMPDWVSSFVVAENVSTLAQYSVSASNQDMSTSQSTAYLMEVIVLLRKWLFS